ncbi:hypothetical protein ACWKX9_25355 [Enterobacter asburiae]
MKILSNNAHVTTIPILEHKELETLFLELAKEIKCSYLTYMIEYKSCKLYLTSNEEWKNELISNKLMNSCPIYDNAFKALEKHESIVTIWDAVHHKRGIERDIMDYRTSFDIAHGVGLAISSQEWRESLVLAGKRDDPFFYERVNSAVIQNSLSKFRKFITSRKI